MDLMVSVCFSCCVCVCAVSEQWTVHVGIAMMQCHPVRADAALFLSLGTHTHRYHIFAEGRIRRVCFFFPNPYMLYFAMGHFFWQEKIPRMCLPRSNIYYIGCGGALENVRVFSPFTISLSLSLVG